ncbi:MAG: DUF4124 domain-containing protein [Pseudomonadales bacterium]|nr:DUF4124 domain-containing protein [Pseudomonadales bacterium]MDP6471773.1 DUF4124 domain-containing protein [Pseudomonadales bacterium]MDP6828813.1 DUF4124 domain-containing protein [Pseudomonadales bacterium]
MRLLTFLLVLAWLPWSVQAATKIYKVVDEDGNAVFTDVPPPEETNAAEIDLGTHNSFESNTPPPSLWEIPPDQTLQGGENPVYSAAKIIAPANDEGLRDNAGTVNVQTRVAPGLRPGHRLRLLLDGEPAENGTAGQFRLANLSRGSHTLTLEIVDAGGTAVFRGAPSTFHLQRTARRP